MKILLWHGYLLGGTGSNVYTRALAREWSRAGHDVTVFSQESHPERHDIGGAGAVRPDVGGLLPVFVRDRYEGYEVKLVQECTRAELDRWVEANAAALRDTCRPISSSATTSSSAARSARRPAPASPSRRTAPSSSTPCVTMPRSQPGAGRRSPRADAVFVGSATSGEVLEEVVGHVENVHEVPPGVDIDEWRPRPRAEALAGFWQKRVATPRTPATRASACRTRTTPSGSPRFLAGDEPTIVYFGKLLYNKGVHVLLEALHDVDARAVLVGFGDYRAELERTAGRRVLFTGPLEHRHLVHLLALADVTVVPSIFPEAFGMVAAEAAAAGSPPLVARHSGLAEIADGLEAGVSAAPRAPRRLRDGRREELAEKLNELLALPDGIERRSARPHAAPPSPAGAGPGSPDASSNPSTTLQRMGDEQRFAVRRLLRSAREAFDDGTDFTVAVEEEFALLDPATLGLVNRFEELQAAAQGTPIEPHLVGELIASEVEIKTGRCATFADVPAAMAERREQLAALVEPMGIALGGTGTHPWSPWQEQRIIDTPHYRATTSCSATSSGVTTRSGCTSTSGSAAPTVRSRSPTGSATSCPSCSPSRRARRSSRTSTRACTPPARRSSRASSRAAACPTPSVAGSPTRTTCASCTRPARSTEHTQLWWSVRPHLAFPTVEIRICDAQPDLADAQALAAFAASLAARIARANDEGEPVPQQPHRLIEENTWRAIRYGLSGELIDLERGDVRPG